MWVAIHNLATAVIFKLLRACALFVSVSERSLSLGEYNKEFERLLRAEHSPATLNLCVSGRGRNLQLTLCTLFYHFNFNICDFNLMPEQGSQYSRLYAVEGG